MLLKKVAKFCKSAACPSAETLMQFNSADLLLPEIMTISEHLATCDFCATELYFLTNFPQSEADCLQATEIPPALKQLAEALLGSKQTESRLLESLLYGNEQLTLKNA